MYQIGFPIQTTFISRNNDSVRLLFEVTDGLDYRKLYETCYTLDRNPAVDHVILFRIIALAICLYALAFLIG